MNDEILNLFSEDDENKRECTKCGGYYPKSDYWHGGWCKICWNKYIINIRFLQKIKNINPIKRDKIVLYYFKTLNQQDITEQIQNMSDYDIKTILNNILKNSISIDQVYYRNRRKKNKRLLNK